MTTQSNRKIDTAAEDTYWKSQYRNENYYEPGSQYADYQGAYRTGYEGRGRYGNRTFDQAEDELQADWERTKGNTRLAWNKAKHAAKAAWHRVERALPGDADNDGQ